MDDIIKEFAVESHECLDTVEQGLLTLEKNPGATEVIAGVFRGVHTIKGSSGFLGLPRLQSIAHSGESLLSRLRDGHLTTTPAITSALLRLLDVLRGMISTLQSTGAEPTDDHSALIAELEALQNPAAPVAPVPTSVTPPIAPTPAPVASPMPSVAPVTPIILPAPAAPEPPMAAEPKPPVDAPASAPAVSPEGNVRVHVGLLDKLMNLVGELVLARNQIVQLNANQTDVLFATASQRLNLVTTELQGEIMKTRLQPIGNVWTKLPRLVRDVAGDLGRKVRIDLEGAETELDRTIIEAIKDPLTHLVRNSIDHGIEPPATRTALGKDETGVLSLRAYHEGGQVNIEIADDGRGIDVAKVRSKAVELGVISAEQINRMSEREALQLVFHPGLSTASKVTSVSGRGVGMDVVKTNIEKIGGSVDIQTQRGHGTTVKIKIPLTLAIIPALMVTCGGERYAIPQVSLVELVRLDTGEGGQSIETIMGAPVYRLRGRLLPIVQLSEALGRSPLPDQAAQGSNLVVLQADDIQFGLVVDRINDTQEIVVKPLGKHLKGVPVFAGATILGDGKVALIIDVLGLAQKAQVVAVVQERKAAEGIAAAGQQSADFQRLLLFSLGADSRLAIDLGTVGRLEKFPLKSVEQVAGREVIQYRGQIMNLVRLGDCLGESTVSTDTENMQVVVYSNHGRSVGLIVGNIIDIIEDDIPLQTHSTRLGVRGTAVIQGRVTEILDLPALVQASGVVSTTA